MINAAPRIVRFGLLLLGAMVLLVLLSKQVVGADMMLENTLGSWTELSRGVLYGLHVSLLFSALLCYTLLRQKLCLWYALLAVSVLAPLLAYDYAFSIPMDETDSTGLELRVAGFLLCAGEASVWLFSLYFLNTIESQPGRQSSARYRLWRDRIAKVMLMLCVVRALLVMLLPVMFVGLLAYYLSLLTPPLLLCFGLIAALKGKAPGFMFASSWLLLVLVLVGYGSTGYVMTQAWWASSAGIHLVGLLMLALMGLAMLMLLTSIKPVQIRFSGHQIKPLFGSLEEAQLLAKVSHEIRTPMNGILGLTELLQETRLDAEQRRFVKAIRNAGDALVEVVNDVLDLSRLEAGKLKLKPRPFSIAELIKDSVLIFELAARRKGIQLSCTLMEGLPQTVIGDGGRVRQVLINLVSNAIKYTERGFVRLDVGLSDHIIDNQIVLKIDVLDSGIGISDQDKAELFETYSQLDSPLHDAEVGAGLGLAISRQLAELMGGEIGVDSYPGRGSRFWFTVPVGVNDEWIDTAPDSEHYSAINPATGDVDRSSDGVTYKPNALGSLSSTGAYADLRILVAEDNEINQKVIFGFLDRLGMHADCVVNGKQALDRVKITDIPYDLILMDCEMPVMDGFVATQTIHQWQAQQGLAKVPIIALSAYATDFHILKAEQSGMALHLAKPLTFQRFAAAIERALQLESRQAGEAFAPETRREESL